MRPLVLASLAVASCAALAACSSSGGATADDGGVDGTASDDSGATGSDGNGGPDGTVPGDASAPKDGGGKDGTGAGSDASDAPSGETGPIPTCDAGAVAAGDRVLTVVNECPAQTVVVGVNGGYVQDCNAGTCPAGMACSTSRNPPGCFWDLPTPACGKPVLGSGEAATYILGAPGVGGIKWSGNVYASTQCASDGSACKTAECATSVQGMTIVQPCPDGTGPQGPTTLAEFTLGQISADYYDVSAINGVNIPIAMGPLGGTADPSNPYTCATAGAVAASTGLVSCSWSFTPSIALGGTPTDESTLLRAVTPGGAACTSDASCTAPQVCGTALVLGGSAATTSCGTQIAWWTADELCAYTGNTYGAPLDCNQTVGGQGTVDDLYGCAGANATSCYGTGAGATCCGCPDWVIGGQTLAIPPGFSCHSTNPTWSADALPWDAFLKNACPTAYSFPFDDATSTFTCASAGTPNAMGYVITLCPGGKTGM